MFLRILKNFFIFGRRFFVLLIITGTPFAYADSINSNPVLRNEFIRWLVYYHSPDSNRKICYTVTVPTSAQPETGVKHGINFFMIGLKKETKDSYISELVMDYPLDENTMVSIEVIGKNSSGQIFTMHPHNNRATFQKESDNEILIKEMKLGKEVIVSAKSKRGTNTRYVYSLSGLSDALADLPKCQ
ncbi:hypothetical protein CKC_04185 [Candidatus Liberibacter solanacearum CLso-ZC1]|uniref:Uncharacterized protein n=1 Tax=Liberibacter solanacearum (strain CLso-ZC1) TaxID=658172 RepID=E4UBA7_LIBSC|nr:hypothetical protein [Candidatus Liberibacter solanacearum]ADR52586.1 hypothetical protein CKC_04185 [Candidatus Liberibacter solanacearum CLso-ZC1]